MNRQVELGEAEWLMVKVECRLNGQEIGSSMLGGVYLDKYYDLKSCVYDNGLIDNAKAEAIAWLKESKEVFDDVA